MTGQTFRTASVFDGTGADGRPLVDRKLLDQTEAGHVLAYLESAPVVLASQDLGPDQVDRGRGQQVPLTWQTDGEWLWPGSVPYYLRTYALPPDHDFLDHIRQRQYRAPSVDPATRRAALSAVSGNGRPADQEDAMPPSTPTPADASASPDAPGDDSSAFDRLRSAAFDLGVPAGAYRIGAAADGAWCLSRAGSRWTVFLSDRGERRQAAAFDTSHQAIAYLVGQLYLSRPAGHSQHGVADPGGRVATAVNAPAAEPGFGERYAASERHGFREAPAGPVAGPKPEPAPAARPERPAAKAPATQPIPSQGMPGQPPSGRRAPGQPGQPAAGQPAPGQAGQPVAGQAGSEPAAPGQPASGQPALGPGLSKIGSLAAGLAAARAARPPFATETGSSDSGTGPDAGGRTEVVSRSSLGARPFVTGRTGPATEAGPSDVPGRRDRPGDPDAGARPGAPGLAGRSAIAGRPDRTGHEAIGRPDPTGPEQPAQPEATGRPDRTGQAEATGLPDAPAMTGQPDATGAPGRTSQPEATGAPAGTGQAETAGAARTGQPETAGTSESPGQPESTGRPEAAGQPDPSGRPERAGLPKITGRPDMTGGPVIMGRSDVSGGPEAAGRAEAAAGPDAGGTRDADGDTGTGARANGIGPVEGRRRPYETATPEHAGGREKHEAPRRRGGPEAAGERPASDGPGRQPGMPGPGAQPPAHQEPHPAEAGHRGAGEPRPAGNQGISSFLDGPRAAAAGEPPMADRPGGPARAHAATTTGPDAPGQAPPASGTGKPPQWKVQPLAGEPPLTLYRDKRMVMLPAGTEIDRYGDPDGNVAYAARTQFQHRSLPADWGDNTYHLYRLQRPMEALTGIAVPWFEQPGGGTAFVLPSSINELLTDGTLVEVSQAQQNG
ncbi:MAG TPA: glycohydrolase toxin TNT-related protein [Pseudonocardiaceae bacterium]|nr:glycohydrolase toxin TNT-related protein [Pseudonocardiaceae bacterium]